MVGSSRWWLHGDEQFDRRKRGFACGSVCFFPPLFAGRDDGIKRNRILAAKQCSVRVCLWVGEMNTAGKQGETGEVGWGGRCPLACLGR